MKFTAEPGLKHLPRSHSMGYLFSAWPMGRESRRVASRRIDENHREIYFAYKILGGTFRRRAPTIPLKKIFTSRETRP